MKKFLGLVLITPLLALAACSSNDSGSNNGTSVNPSQPSGSDDSVMVVEVQSLANTQSESYVMSGTLSFDKKTNSNATYDQQLVYRVKNSSDSAIAVSRTIQGTAGEFTEVSSTCAATIPANSACDVKLSFNGGARKNGMVRDAIFFRVTAAAATGGTTLPGLPTPTPTPAAQANTVSLQLQGDLEVQGNDIASPANSSGSTNLTITGTAFARGGNPLQQITITNGASDIAPNLAISASSGYMIFGYNCPMQLQENEACTVSVLYIDYIGLESNAPDSSGVLTVSSDRSPTYQYSFTGGGTSSSNND